MDCQFNLPDKLIVCLRHKGNTGKTGTIKALADYLINTLTASAAVWYDWKHQHPPHPIKQPANIGKEQEISVELTVKGKRIGLFSFGDNNQMAPHLEVLAKNNCYRIFCTCRTSRATVKAVEDIAKKYGYIIVWTAPYWEDVQPAKTATPFQTSLNNLKGRHLADFI
jgi:hypothetical protein